MKGVRRTLIAIGFGALVAFAASAEAASEGPYVGIVGGYQSTTAEGSIPLGGATVKVDPIALTGTRAGAVLGWGDWSNDIYGALEVNGAISFADASVSVNGDRLKWESKETYGASVLFGGRVVPGALLYVRGGWQRAKLSASLNGESESEWFSGIRAGVGGMWALSDVVTFRLEYTHSFYQSEELKVGGTTLELEPHENVFQAGFTVGF